MDESARLPAGPPAILRWQTRPLVIAHKARTWWWRIGLAPAPSVLAWRTRDEPKPSLDAVCVYRYKNAQTTAALLSGLPKARWALWALDKVHPSLALVTVGEGPGHRTALLNRLTEHLGPTEDERYLLQIDDDVEITAGGLALMAQAAAAAELDLVAPAHDAQSHISHNFTRARSFTLGRLTRFVECGPTLLFSPRSRSLLLPYPDHMQMGWGMEVIWASQAIKHTLSFAIIDAVHQRHLGHFATHYHADTECAIVIEELATAGLSSIRELQVVLKRWGLFGPWAAPTPTGPK